VFGWGFPALQYRNDSNEKKTPESTREMEMLQKLGGKPKEGVLTVPGKRENPENMAWPAKKKDNFHTIVVGAGKPEVRGELFWRKESGVRKKSSTKEQKKIDLLGKDQLAAGKGKPKEEGARGKRSGGGTEGKQL